jgi:DNA-binding NtrC family response regulator
MSPHLLFVDDDIPIRETLSLYFKKKGIVVTTAGSGGEAIRLAEKSSFNLAILDVNLDQENGLDLLEVFRRMHPNLPVIMFTGMADDPMLLQQALAKGASSFMSKTDPLDKLFNEVQRVMSAA